MDVAEHMLRSRGEKGDCGYDARRARYLLSSWHSHLSSRPATKKGVLVLYHHRVLFRPLPRSSFTITRRVVGTIIGGGRRPPPTALRNPASTSFFSPLAALLTLKPFSVS
ncbi:hypothetical protein X777_08351 [Ooceraea biroi]|uniref:Uncharacterized protein n=1 Tax=Ooceraea biroi TaxID=2015173 RepID=A0A026X1A1_OOCBI|nr:hypothetical protein X777_08351 [Ooceraea biroi]